MRYLPRMCNHCLNPACVAACPSCPYKKVFYSWETNKSEKCTFCYPDAAWREKRTELEAAIQTVDDESMAAVLNAFVEHVFSCDAHEFEGRYVDAFDFSKETNLNLTSQSCKDERQQRMTLLGYSLYFENAGVTPGEELPDYLPSLLELSAAVDVGTAARILRRAVVHAHRAHVQRRHRRVQVSRSQGDRVPPPQGRRARAGKRTCPRVPEPRHPERQVTSRVHGCRGRRASGLCINPCQRARVCVVRALALCSAARQTAAAATAGQARLPPSRETPRGGCTREPRLHLRSSSCRAWRRTAQGRRLRGARASPSAQSAARPPGNAPECPEGDGFCRGTARGRRIRGRFRHPRRVPRRPHSPDGAGRPEGDSRRREPAQGGTAREAGQSRSCLPGNTSD